MKLMKVWPELKILRSINLFIDTHSFNLIREISITRSSRQLYKGAKSADSLLQQFVFIAVL